VTPTDGAYRFCVAEFHSGPADGLRWRLEYPPPQFVDFPTPVGVARYRRLDTLDGGDVQFISDLEVRLAKCDVLAYHSERIAALTYVYDGTEPLWFPWGEA